MKRVLTYQRKNANKTTTFLLTITQVIIVYFNDRLQKKVQKNLHETGLKENNKQKNMLTSQKMFTVLRSFVICQLKSLVLLSLIACLQSV